MRPMLCATLIPLVSLACSAGHDVHKKHVGRSFTEKVQTPFTHTLEASRKVVMEYLDGTVDISGTSGGHVVVTGTRTDQADSKDRLTEVAQDVQLTTEAKDGTARIIVEGPWKMGHPKHRENWGKDARVTYDFKVQVPAGAELVLAAVNGGTMVIRNVHGAIKVSNVNGNIQLEGAQGACRLNTVNGSIEAAFQQTPAGACSFNTVNGHVKLKAPGNLNADLKLSTVHGQMVTDFDIPADPKEHHGIHMPGFSRKIQLGQGGPALTCSTVNGDLVIKKADR